MDSVVEYYPAMEQEFKAIMAAVADIPLAEKLFPELSAEERKQRFAAYESVRQFQADAMFRGCQYIVNHTMDGFSWSGEQYLDGKPCLFISNHRDIVLDAMLLQYMLISLGRDTTHVVVGTNLFEMPLMLQLAKVNKMIGMPRGGNRKEYYNILMEMSSTLHRLVNEEKQSVWIAQRNGRTKDGHDHTEPALLKMIARNSNSDSPVQALASMNIVPLSVSYEWEPCGMQKAREMCLRRQGPYVKTPGEDTQSIVSGMMDYKGRVHLAVCQPISPDEIAALNGNENLLAELIDRRISDNFRLFEGNRVAADLLRGRKVDDTEKTAQFIRYIDDACIRAGMGDEFRQTLLGIYAAPVLGSDKCSVINDNKF